MTLTQNGGDYLGKGMYGCVFRPPIKCQQKLKNIKTTEKNNLIGKVFKENPRMTQEYNMVMVIKNIDPNHLFTLQVYGHCHINKTDYEKNKASSNCDVVYNKNKSDTQIVYEYGGVDLKKLPHKKTYIMDVLRRLIYIVEGLKTLYNNDLMHNDVKLQNLVYSTSNKKLALIDFGLAIHKNDLTWSLPFDWYFKVYKPHAPDFHIVDLMHRYHQDNKAFDERLTWTVAYVNFISQLSPYKYSYLLDNKTNKKHFKNLFNLYKSAYVRHKQEGLEKVFDDSKSKADIYSIGIALFDLYSSYNNLLSSNDNQILKKLIAKLTIFDYRKRSSFDQTIILFRKYFPF